MVSVDYEKEFIYFDDGRSRFPGFVVQMTNPQTGSSVDVEAHLDSGAERSLFDGQLATVIGLELLDGAEQLFGPTAGPQISARLHRVRLEHQDLGTFELDIGLTTEPIKRNLLGRDFFDQVQIGFRERYQKFFVTAHS